MVMRVISVFDLNKANSKPAPASATSCAKQSQTINCDHLGHSM